MAGPGGWSSPCTPGPGFPRGGGFSLCFCPHPTSVLLPVTRRAPGALAPSPQLHLGRWRGSSLRVCKTRALFHTPLTSLGEGGGGQARRLSWLLAERPTTRRARGGQGMLASQHVSAPAEGACGKGNVAQHGPGARATQLPRSLSKSHHSRVPCTQPLPRTGSSQPRQPLLRRGDPRGCHPA